MSRKGDLKDRVSAVTAHLNEIFGPAVRAGEKNVFCRSRVLEFEARREGFKAYAAFNAGLNDRKSKPSGASELARDFPQFFPFLDYTDDAIAQELKKAIFQRSAWRDLVQDRPGYILLIIGPRHAEFRAASIATAGGMKSEWRRHPESGYGGGYFFAALNVFPIQSARHQQGFDEYVSTHVKEWALTLHRKVERQLEHTLREAKEVMSAIDEALYCALAPNSECRYWTRPFLIDKLYPDIEVMLVGRAGDHILGMLRPRLLVDSGVDSEYSVPFVLINPLSVSLSSNDGAFCTGTWHKVRLWDVGTKEFELAPIQGLKPGIVSLETPSSLHVTHSPVMHHDVCDLVDGVPWVKLSDAPE